MIRENQIKGLLEASEHCLIAGLLINFRNENNDTFFISISQFQNMIENLNKKSFNKEDLKNAKAIKILSNKKRTRYTYDIKNFIKEVIVND